MLFTILLSLEALSSLVIVSCCLACGTGAFYYFAKFGELLVPGPSGALLACSWAVPGPVLGPPGGLLGASWLDPCIKCTTSMRTLGELAAGIVDSTRPFDC